MTTDLVAGPRNRLRPCATPTSRAAATSASATCGSGPSAPPTTRSAASATCTPRDIWRNLDDPAIANDPFTGIPEPFRASYEVRPPAHGHPGRAGRRASCGTSAARPGCRSPPGTTAVSKVTFDYSKYLRSDWHDGQPITIGRRRLRHRAGLRLRLRPGQGTHRDGPGGDLAAVPRDVQGLPAAPTTTGSRSTSTTGISTRTTSPPTPARPASTCPGRSWPPWTTWSSSSAGRRTRDTAAGRFSVPWLSLVHDAATRGWWTGRCARCERAGRRARRASSSSAAATLVTPDEADGRATRPPRSGSTTDGHLVISHGPFYLARFDPAGPVRASWTRSATRATRSGRGDFDRGAPPTLAIGDIDAPDHGAGRGRRRSSVTVAGPGHARAALPADRPRDRRVVVSSGAATQASTPGAFA